MNYGQTSNHKGAANLQTYKTNEKKSREKLMMITQEERVTADKYRTFFQKLFNDTQMNDVDEIIDAYIHVDEDNENLYQEINELTNQIDQIEGVIKAEKSKMFSLKQLTPDEQAKYNNVMQMESEIEKNENTIQTYDQKLQGIERNISSFRTGLPPILDLLEIDLGSRKTADSGELMVNERNLGYLLELLTKVENKVFGILEINKNIDHKESSEYNNYTMQVREDTANEPQETKETKNGDEVLKKLTGIAKKLNYNEEIGKREELITVDIENLRRETKSMVASLSGNPGDIRSRKMTVLKKSFNK